MRRGTAYHLSFQSTKCMQRIRGFSRVGVLYKFTFYLLTFFGVVGLMTFRNCQWAPMPNKG